MPRSELIPPILDDYKTNTAISELYREVNSILTSLTNNSRNYQETLNNSVRAVFDESNNTHRIEGKTDKGWISAPAQLETNLGKYSNMMKLNLDGELEIFKHLKIGNTTLSSSKLSSTGDIELNADGGQITIKDGTASHFLFDCDNTALTIYDDQDEGDLFKIQVAQYGATTISTVDDLSFVAHLTLDPDGEIFLDARPTLNSYTSGIRLKSQGTEYGTLTTHHSLSCFTLYEAAGASNEDYFGIEVGSAGATTLKTVDVAGAAAHLTLNPDGHIKFITGDGEVDSVEYIIGSNTYAAFSAEDGSYSKLKIYENGGESSSDFFHINVTEHGEAEFKTVDAAAAAANLNMLIDGGITLDSAGEIVIDHTDRFKFKKAGTEYVKFDVDGSSQFTMFEQGGASTNDYLLVNVATNGATTLQTVDAAGADADLTLFPDGDLILKVGSGGTFMKEAASAATDKLGYGQLWVKNATPNELYFTNAAGADIQITSGSSIAGGGGGTSRWSNTAGGYKTNNNSSTTYYFPYYPDYHVWANSDSSPTTLSYTDSYAYNFCAPADGALTNITVTCRASDTGVTDPLKFYVFKGVPSNEATTVSLTQIGVTGTITPVSAKQMHLSTDISSSNTFSAGDKLWVMLKKDSTSGNQDLYFAVTISGTYS